LNVRKYCCVHQCIIYYNFTDAPVISILPRSPHIVTVGEDKDPPSLYCSAHGLPEPTVQWYKDGQPVVPVANPLFQRLEVLTNFPHTTVYTCVGNNTIATTSANITVIVEGMLYNYVILYHVIYL